MIRVFVGSDPRQAPAERALERSIRANTEREVEITWMRAGDPGWADEWNRGAPPGKYKPKSGHGWGTYFSCFRLAIPSLCGYEGRAIYLDSDMLVLGDIGELYDLPLNGHAAVVNRKMLLDVMLLDCGHEVWRGKAPIDDVRKRGAALGLWRRKLISTGALSPTLPDAWDCRDQKPPSCKLLHFTTMPTQPWRPWPEHMEYREHPDRACLEEWRRWSADDVVEQEGPMP